MLCNPFRAITLKLFSTAERAIASAAGNNRTQSVALPGAIQITFLLAGAAHRCHRLAGTSLVGRRTAPVPPDAPGRVGSGELQLLPGESPKLPAPPHKAGLSEVPVLVEQLPHRRLGAAARLLQRVAQHFKDWAAASARSPEQFKQPAVLARLAVPVPSLVRHCVVAGIVSQFRPVVFILQRRYQGVHGSCLTHTKSAQPPGGIVAGSSLRAAGWRLPVHGERRCYCFGFPPNWTHIALSSWVALPCQATVRFPAVSEC